MFSATPSRYIYIYIYYTSMVYVSVEEIVSSAVSIRVSTPTLNRVSYTRAGVDPLSTGLKGFSPERENIHRRFLLLERINPDHPVSVSSLTRASKTVFF